MESQPRSQFTASARWCSAAVAGGRSAIAAISLAFLLTGCVKAHVDLTVQPNDQIDGTIVMAVDRSFIPPGEKSEDALVSEVQKRTFKGTATGAQQVAYSDERYVGTEVIIRGMTLLDFGRSTADTGLKIVHQGGRFRLSGTFDTVRMAPASTISPEDARRLADSFDVLIRVTFPGRVINSNGKVEGRTVTWRPSLGQRVNLAAEAEDGPGGFSWPWLLIGLLSLASAGVLTLALRPGGGERGRTPTLRRIIANLGGWAARGLPRRSAGLTPDPWRRQR